MAKKTKKKYLVIEIVLIVLIIACIGCYISFISFKNSLFIPDYAIDKIDSNAKKEEEASKNNLPENIDGRVTLNFTDKISVDKKAKKISLYFKNPGTSTDNMVLYVIVRQNDKEIVLGKSDLIPPGYVIKEMNLDDASTLQKGGYNGILKAIYYNMETNAREIVDSEINVKIEVR